MPSRGFLSTTGDAYYYATNIEGGNGDITIDAGNNLYFDQVQDSQRSSNIKFSGHGKLSLGGSSGSKEFRLEGGGGYQQGRSQRTDAIVSKINTQGNVTLKAGADLTTKVCRSASKEPGQAMSLCWRLERSNCWPRCLAVPILMIVRWLTSVWGGNEQQAVLQKKVCGSRRSG